MLEHKVRIPACPAGGYTISIGTEILGALWAKIEADFGTYHKFVVTDQSVAAAGLMQKLLGERDVPTFIISPAGETSKNIGTVTSIIEAME